jgi:hypothetical protein
MAPNKKKTPNPKGKEVRGKKQNKKLNKQKQKKLSTLPCKGKRTWRGERARGKQTNE